MHSISFKILIFSFIISWFHATVSAMNQHNSWIKRRTITISPREIIRKAKPDNENLETFTIDVLSNKKLGDSPKKDPTKDFFCENEHVEVKINFKVRLGEKRIWTEEGSLFDILLTCTESEEERK